MDFSEWLTSEIENKGWSRSEAARRGKISPSALDKVINGHAKPGIKILDGVAKALRISPIEVYRKAGLLSLISENNIELEDWKDILTQLPDDEREELKQIALLKIEKRKKKK